MTPSLPTFSIASAIILPISSEPDEIVAMFFTSSLVVTWWEFFNNASATTLAAFSIPSRISTGLAPFSTALRPAVIIDWVKIVAVVVPSPANSFVLLAASYTNLAPIFSNLSSSSTSLAIVTPSFVITGEPNDFSNTTFLPFGPKVTFTASANLLTPSNIS